MAQRASHHQTPSDGEEAVLFGAAALSPPTSLSAGKLARVATARHKVAGPSFAGRCSPATLVLLPLLALALLSGGYLRGLSDGAARAKKEAATVSKHVAEWNGPGTANITSSGLGHSHVSGADFIFLVAIEGSGHHFYQVLYNWSPAKRTLLHRLEIPALAVMDLHLSLWNVVNQNEMRATGLFSSPCAAIEPNGTAIVENLADQMRVLDDVVRSASLLDGKSVMIPLNSALSPGPDGMMSYPNFLGQCRYLQYPDLGALYRACDVAGVACRHIVLTRDPHAAFSSIYRQLQEFHIRASKAQLLKLYTTMLDVILAQIEAHPDRLAVCWEYTEVPEDGLGTVLGWGDGGDGRDPNATLKHFQDTYASLFRAKPLTEAERSEIIPLELTVYMKSMMEATERNQRKCRELMQMRQMQR